MVNFYSRLFASKTVVKKLSIASIFVLFIASFLVAAPAPKAYAITAAECYTKFNGKKIEPGSITQEWRDCVDAKYCAPDAQSVAKCNLPSDPIVNSNAQAAAIAPLVITVCGEAPASEAIYDSVYKPCADAVKAMPAKCLQQTIEARAACIAQLIQQLKKTMNWINTPDATDVKEALAKGQEASQAVLDAYKTKLDCEANGGTWDDTTKTCAQDSTDGSPCGVDGALAWLACPLTTAMTAFANKLTEMVKQLMHYDTVSVFGDNASGNTFFNAFKIFRNVGMGLIVLAGLTMIISQAAGLEFFDAYTVKKLLPRLGVALIGMALAWPLLHFAVGFFNDLATWTHSLITLPFSKMSPAEWGFGQEIASGATNAVITVTGFLFVLVNLWFLGPFGVVLLLLSIVLAIFIGLLVFAVRQIIITMCILFAPLAIAAYVLPGTQKVWAFWKNTLITTLMTYPIVMALLATGEVMARVMGTLDPHAAGAGYLIVVLVYYAPYFMLPYAFKMAGGLMSTIFSIANDRNRGLFDRSRKARQSTKARRKEALVASGGSGNNRFTRAISRTASDWAARTSLPDQGGFSVSRQGRSQFREARRKVIQETAKKKAGEDAFFSLGDTEATRAAMHARTENDFIRNYMGQGHTEAEARTAMGRLQASIGPIGSDQMRVAAARGHFADKTAYWDADNHATDYNRMAADMAQLVDDGLISVQDAAGMMSNEERPDYSVHSFSEKMNMVQQAQANHNAPGGAYGLTADQSNTWRQRSYEQMRSSGAMFANQRAAEAVSRTAQERTSAALNATAGTDAASMQENQDQVAREFATLGNMHDVMPSASPQAREEFSRAMLEEVDLSSMSPEVRQMFDGIEIEKDVSIPLFHPDGRPDIDPVTGHQRVDRIVTEKKAPGNTIYTKQDLLDHLRATANPLYTARHREYGSATAAYRSSQAQSQSQAQNANNT